MKASGNGTPEQCVDNLLKTFRGEVPYERVKGLNPRTIDRPIAESEIDIRQDADWLINTYEPRVGVNGISITTDDNTGALSITADITKKGG
ncbi:MAG: early E1A protein [Clostridiales bacterium]|nr:early E1A protein [Clostridiales bacterium]